MRRDFAREQIIHNYWSTQTPLSVLWFVEYRYGLYLSILKTLVKTTKRVQERATPPQYSWKAVLSTILAWAAFRHLCADFCELVEKRLSFGAYQDLVFILTQQQVAVMLSLAKQHTWRP
jgi:hypothetical protein